MAEGVKLLLKQAHFHLKVLYLRADDSSMKCELRGDLSHWLLSVEGV